MDPQVEHVVQEDVREQWTDARALWRTFDGFGPHVPFEHAGPQPSADEPEDSGVGDPMCEHPQQPLVVDRVEEATDRVEHPVHVLRQARRVQRSQRQVRTPARPKSIGEAHEVDLVDGAEELSHRTLGNLVFQRRYAERSQSTVGFGD